MENQKYTGTATARHIKRFFKAMKINTQYQHDEVTRKINNVALSVFVASMEEFNDQHPTSTMAPEYAGLLERAVRQAVQAGFEIWTQTDPKKWIL